MSTREPCDYCGARKACAHYPDSVDGFPARVRLAAQCIRTRQGTHSRAFDNCFEMYDGDIVAVMLDRMALQDPALCAGMADVWDNQESRAGLAATVAKYANIITENLPQEARKIRSDRQRAQLRAAAPMRPANGGSHDVDGLPLFDKVRQPDLFA